MDVPSWHPANQEADSTRARLLTGNEAPKRTEFKVMAGSSADTSTEAGRQLLNDLTRAGDGGGAAYEGRGFFDASDRLYLLEQKRLEEEEQTKKRAVQEAELQSFRSKAMKIQAEKVNLSLVPDVLPVGNSSISEKKKLVPSLVKIKPKKRTAAPLESKTAKRKQVAQDKEEASKSESNATGNSTASKKQTSKKEMTPGKKADKPTAPAPAKVGLLLGYSSSSSDSEADA